MRKILIAVALILALSPAVKAGSGFLFYASSSVIVGTIAGNGSGLTNLPPKVFVSTVQFSTSTSYSISQTAPNVCITGSTLTFTSLSGDRFWVGYSGEVEHIGGSTELNMSFRLDGSLVPPISPTVHPWGYEGDGGNERNASWRFSISPSAGTHSVCFIGYVVTGSFELPTNNAHTFLWSKYND